MTKRKSAIAAAVKAAAGGNSVFVLASRKDDLPTTDKQLESVLASAKIAAFACNACGTSMHALADTAPFCVTCGANHEHVHETEATAKTKVSAKSDLVSLHCSTCDHTTTMEAGIVNAMTASSKEPVPIHCSCCGSEMYVTAEAEDGSSFSNNTLVAPDVEEVTAETDCEEVDASAAKLKSGTEVVASDEMDEDVALEDLDDLDDIEAGSFKSKSDVDMEATSVEASDKDLLLEAYTVEEDSPTDNIVLNSSVDDMAYSEDVGFMEPEGDPLVDALEMDDTDLALAFVRANGRVIAMKGHVSVASFSKASAGENYRLMNSEALPVAAKAAVNAEGLRKGLQSVGFALVKVPVTSNAVVARKMQEIKASAVASKVEEKKQFASVFALAAAGLNRGSWKGYSNPLRAAVEMELTRIGVQSPRRVVASIFEEAGVGYAQTLLQVSDRLSRMSASARKELAEMLEMTDVTSSAAVEDDEAEDGGAVEASTRLETRFATPALLRPKITSSAQSLSTANDVLSGKAPLAFASV